MKKKTAARKILYTRYREEQAEYAEAVDLGEKMGVDPEQIVVQKVSTVADLARTGTDLLLLIGKVAFYLVVLVLASIGLTVLLNESLRLALLELSSVS